MPALKPSRLEADQWGAETGALMSIAVSLKRIADIEEERLVRQRRDEAVQGRPMIVGSLAENSK